MGNSNGDLVAAIIDCEMSNIMVAMEAALNKHGPCTSDPVRGSLNLAEEVGEVASEALDATRDLLLSGRPDSVSLYLMCNELAQAVGYGILLMDSMRRLLRAQAPDKPVMGGEIG